MARSGLMGSERNESWLFQVSSGHREMNRGYFRSFGVREE